VLRCARRAQPHDPRRTISKPRSKSALQRECKQRPYGAAHRSMLTGLPAQTHLHPHPRRLRAERPDAIRAIGGCAAGAEYRGSEGARAFRISRMMTSSIMRDLHARSTPNIRTQSGRGRVTTAPGHVQTHAAQQWRETEEARPVGGCVGLRPACDLRELMASQDLVMQSDPKNCERPARIRSQRRRRRVPR
jgi:hypothetical protein